MHTASLKTEFAAPSLTGFRQAWTWRPLASLTPARVADILRRAAMGDAHEFLIAAADIEEKDLHYRAVLQTRKLAVAGLPWDVQPADESRAAKRAADLARRALEAVDVPMLVVQLLDALSKGYAVAEILWDTDGPAWLPARIIAREAHWFVWDRETGREPRLADGTVDGQPIPPYKLIVHAPGIVSGIPLMGGLARSALWAWVFKSYALRDWASFAEIYGQPIRVGKYEPGATREDIAVLKRAVFELGSDAGAVIPAGMALEIIESGAKSASADLYQRLIEYLDRQVSKAVLGQTLTTDQGASGSLAQARVHNEVRTDMMHADARAVAATLVRDLIAPVIALNLPDAPLPRLRLIVEEPEDMAALADQLAKLVPLGLPIPQAWVREKWSIPEAAEGEPVLGAPIGEPLPNGAHRRMQSVHAQGVESPAPDALDDLVTEALSDWEPQMAPMVDVLQALLDRAVAEGWTAQALIDALPGVLPQMDDGALAEALSSAHFVARLAGVHGRDASRE